MNILFQIHFRKPLKIMDFVENKMKYTILCVEDDVDTCELIRFVFEQAEFEVTTCNVQDCLKITDEREFSAIILDNYFDKLNGIDICRQLRERHPQTPIVFFSGEVRGTEREKALAAGANDYLIKPDDFDRLVETISNLVNSSARHA